jgi:hypothetical protein
LAFRQTRIPQWIQFLINDLSVSFSLIVFAAEEDCHASQAANGTIDNDRK